ncbi:hypothetical protein MNEG_4108 [Monoraphidium neglectum]|uniref:Uncharacterized protein n=1 Tax=Monoraphidium neglectum TaxID=145388 RepID=A0A0D2MLY4_9CHLO|nr:hypothetical protein MNEG_4108 [Monoraphidium neglectum]KIZ03855.1 hypothetical protein MNEG_4108 [Monoraphidium neglectum]|eukprot:XP_013902874.1 hypothetical protein MNEG_4108 [Monoraphidium neglectum]
MADVVQEAQAPLGAAPQRPLLSPGAPTSAAAAATAAAAAVADAAARARASSSSGSGSPGAEAFGPLLGSPDCPSDHGKSCLPAHGRTAAGLKGSLAAADWMDEEGEEEHEGRAWQSHSGASGGEGRRSDHALGEDEESLQLSGDGSGGGGDDGAACEPDSGGAHPAGSVWQTLQRFIPSAGINVSKVMVATWFPGVPLPLDISLQLEVDGRPWGDRFVSRITPALNLNMGLRAAGAGLEGCVVTALRRARGAGALDLLLTRASGDPRLEARRTAKRRGGSLGGGGEWGGGKRRRGAEARPAEGGATWPVVRAAEDPWRLGRP